MRHFVGLLLWLRRYKLIDKIEIKNMKEDEIKINLIFFRKIYFKTTWFMEGKVISATFNNSSTRHAFYKLIFVLPFMDWITVPTSVSSSSSSIQRFVPTCQIRLRKYKNYGINRNFCLIFLMLTLSKILIP